MGLGTSGSFIYPLVRSLTLVDVVKLGTAALIGGSIFVLTGPAIGLAGTDVILSLIINECITLFTAMGYAELGSALPETGEGIVGLEKVLHDPMPFLVVGWLGLLIL